VYITITQDKEGRMCTARRDT